MTSASQGNVAEQDDRAAARAVSAIRRSFHPPMGCAATPRCWPAFIEDLEDVTAAFRYAHKRMIDIQGSGLLVAMPGTQQLTRHERRLLRATAAAQADNDQLVDNYLFNLAPEREVRPHLVRAVIVLATSLAIAGHWFPRPAIPAAALLIARMQGIDIHALTVAWPVPARDRKR